MQDLSAKTQVAVLYVKELMGGTGVWKKSKAAVGGMRRISLPCIAPANEVVVCKCPCCRRSMGERTIPLL